MSCLRSWINARRCKLGFPIAALVSYLDRHLAESENANYSGGVLEIQ